MPSSTSGILYILCISYPSIFDLEPKLIEFWFDGCSGKKPDYLGVQRNQQALALCPATKNCISTAENVTDITHYAPPWYACLISFLPFHRLFQCHSRVWMASGPKAPNSWRWLSWSLTKSVVKQGSCKGPNSNTFCVKHVLLSSLHICIALRVTTTLPISKMWFTWVFSVTGTTMVDVIGKSRWAEKWLWRNFSKW